MSNAPDGARITLEFPEEPEARMHRSSDIRIVEPQIHADERSKKVVYR